MPSFSSKSGHAASHHFPLDLCKGWLRKADGRIFLESGIGRPRGVAGCGAGKHCQEMVTDGSVQARKWVLAWRTQEGRKMRRLRVKVGCGAL